MVNKRPAVIPPSADAASRVDGDLVGRAYRKVVNREELSQAERRALKRHEKDKEERLRWQYYRSIPKKHWTLMSGRQHKVVDEQAARYNLPCGGATIDLPAFVRAFHDFLADNAGKLTREEDALLQGGNSPALERYREEKAELARLDRMERQRRLLPRDVAKEALGRIASIIRNAGDALQRKFGVAAAEFLYEAIDDAQREIDRTFGDNASEDEDG